MAAGGSQGTKSVFSRWYEDVQRFFKTEGRPIPARNIPNETKPTQMSEISNQGTTAVSTRIKLNEPKGREVPNSARLKNSNNTTSASHKTPKPKMKAPPPPTHEVKNIETLSENNLTEQKLSEIQTLQVERKKTDDSEESESTSWIEIQHDHFSEIPDVSSLTQDDDCSSDKIIPNEEQSSELQRTSTDPLTERYNALRSENNSGVRFNTEKKHSIDKESNRCARKEFESFSLEGSKGKSAAVAETCESRDIQQINQYPAAESERNVQKKYEDVNLFSSANQICQQLNIHQEMKLSNINTSDNNSKTGAEIIQQIELLPPSDNHGYENWESLRSTISQNTEVANATENVSSLKKSQIFSSNSYQEAEITGKTTNLPTDDIVIASSTHDWGNENEEAIQNVIEIQFRSIWENQQNTVVTSTKENITTNDSNNAYSTLPNSTKTHPDGLGSLYLLNNDKKESSTFPNLAKTYSFEESSKKAHAIEVTKTTDHTSSCKIPAPLPKPTKYHHLEKRDHDMMSKVISEFTNKISSARRTEEQSVHESIVKPINQTHDNQDVNQKLSKSEQTNVESVVGKTTAKIYVAETSSSIQETATTDKDEFVQSIIEKIRSIQQEVAEQEKEIYEFSGTTSDDRNYEYLDECLMRSLIKLDNFDIGNSLIAKEERRKGIRYIQGMLSKLDSKLKENQSKANETRQVVAEMAKKWPQNVKVEIGEDKGTELGQDKKS